MIAAFFVAACTKYAPVTLSEPISVVSQPGLPGVCASMVPGAGRLLKSETATWTEIRQFLEDGDIQGAYERLDRVSDHPAKTSITYVHGLMTGAPPTVPDINTFADAHSGDACVLQFAAAALIAAQEPSALERARESLALDGTNPDTRLIVQMLEGTEDGSMPDRLLTLADMQPDHVPTQLLAGKISIDRGAIDDAVTFFERASVANIPELVEPLYHLRRMSGRLEAYLAQAADLDEPVDVLDMTEGAERAWRDYLGLEDGKHLRATFSTSMGDIHCDLFAEQAPVTVLNFVALARGEAAWLDPDTGEETKRPLYDGTVFHRVIPDFMIQGGDPLGTGRGSPGYRFRDELHPDLRFDVPGRLAMANSGVDTNGSQFFITDVPTPHLDGRHTIFGQCDEVERVAEIAHVETAGSTPVEPVVLKTVTISVEEE